MSTYMPGTRVRFVIFVEPDEHPGAVCPVSAGMIAVFP